MPKELMVGKHVPQHDRHGLQMCRYRKINRETLESGSYTPSSARAASPITFQCHLSVCNDINAQPSPQAQQSNGRDPAGP